MILEDYVNIDKEVREYLNLRVDRPIIIKDNRHLRYDIIKSERMINFIYPSVNFKGERVIIVDDRKSGELTRYIHRADGLDFIVDTYGHTKHYGERVVVTILDPEKRVDLFENQRALNAEISEYRLESLMKGKRI